MLKTVLLRLLQQVSTRCCHAQFKDPEAVAFRAFYLKELDECQELAKAHQGDVDSCLKRLND